MLITCENLLGSQSEGTDQVFQTKRKITARDNGSPDISRNSIASYQLAEHLLNKYTLV